MEFRQGNVGIMVAAARVPVGGGLDGKSFGVVSASAPAVSVYTVVLENPIDASDCTIHVTVDAVATGSATAVQISDNTIAVHTFDDAAAPGDRRFQLAVFRHQVNDQ